MRNLRDYPVTTNEIEKCLLALSEETAAQEIIGDMRPILLRIAARIVVRAEYVLSDLNPYHIAARTVR